MASEAPVGKLPTDPAPPAPAPSQLGRQGPPIRGSGPPPSGYKGGIQVSKIPIQITKELPVVLNPPTAVADKALLEAQKLAKSIKKPADKQVDGGRSIKSVQLVQEAPASSEGVAAAPPAEPPADFFGSLLGTRAPTEEPPPSVKVFKAFAAPPPPPAAGEESANFFADKAVSLGEADDDYLKIDSNDLPADQNEKFRQISEAVTSKLSADPIKVHPINNIFMPINRRGIHEFIIETYKTYILSKPIANPVGDACQEMSKISASTIKNFAYQEFVRDYMQRGSPYRGILVYHGLGSGKTCTSIAAMEGLRYGGSRKIFVMTPATLSGNYHKELSLCGYYAFKKDNHWEQVTVPSTPQTGLDETSSEFVFLTTTYGLSPAYLQKKWGKRKVAKFWVADPSSPVNFDTLEPAQKQEIEEQINAHMDDRFEFIHYNGLREQKVRSWICGTPLNPTPGNLFDNSVIVIDEVD